MSGGTARRLDGTPVQLTPEAVDALAARLAGQLLRPGETGYEDARRVWNGMIDRRPALIVSCSGADDVVTGVRFARDHDLLIAVRGGGHNVAGFGTCDGGIVIDLSPMREIQLDLETRAVRVGGGATWADVDGETGPHGFAVPGGIVSTTGVAGLTLGGGQGWLRRTYGMACDSLVSAEVVTAAGERLHASETENADLFWALRGGGGNFGIVTSFEFRLHPAGPMMAFAGPAYRVESASAVMAGMREFAADAPDQINLSATWWTFPAVEAFPESVHGRTAIVLGATYIGPADEGEAVLQPLRAIETPLLDLSGVLPYVVLQQMFDPFFPAHGLRYYWKSMYLEDLSDAAVSTLADAMAARPSPLSMVGQWVLGGALGRVDPAATATGARDAPYLLEVLANWSAPEDDAANMAWARALFDAMRPHGSGRTNLNFPGLGDDPTFTRAALQDNWDRLVALKRKYDPSNRFRLNQNVEPGSVSG